MATLHEACPGALPAACQLELDVFTCVLSHQAAACCRLHSQHGTLHASAAAAQVHVAAVGCMSALARSASLRRVPMLCQLVSLLREAAEFPGVAEAAQAALAALTLHGAASSSHGIGSSPSPTAAVLTDPAEAAEADAALMRKVTALLQVSWLYRASSQSQAVKRASFNRAADVLYSDRHVVY